MKPFILILLLPLLFISNSCALSIAPDQIKGKKLSKNGETSDPNVKCTLREGFNEGTIEGEIIVTKSFLDLGINLAAWNKEGLLICSWSIQPDTSNKVKIKYWFIIQRDLVENSKLDLFTKKKGMVELHLNTVKILPKKMANKSQ